MIDGTEPELPNGIDDNCDGIGLGDEFCDGIDNDGDGMVDEDAGSCLLRFAFAPVCFSGSDEEFTSMALSSLDFFNASLGLQQCSDNIGRRIILPSEVQSALGSVPCPACTDPAQPATATASLLEAAGLLDPAQYTGVHMIAGASPCGGGIRGAAAGKIIWGLGEWPVIFSHEIGHTAGFGEEYCSAAAGGNCWNSTLNPLEPQYGCDNCCTADYRLENETVSGWEVAANSNEPCGSPGNFIICCPGNRATNPSTGEFLDGDGRCIMSHTDAVGPRGWCPACLDHWQSLTNGSGTRISCDAVFPGAQPLIDLSASVGPGRGLIRGVVAREGLQRPGFHFPPVTGTLRLVVERNGVVLYDAFVPPYPPDYRIDDAPEFYPISAQVPVAPASTPAPFVVSLTEAGVTLSRSTVGGSAPVARAGGDRQVECTDNRRAPVLLDGTASSDADGDTLSFEWYVSSQRVAEVAVAEVELTLGAHEVHLVVDDGTELGSDIALIQVVDTTPPVWGEVQDIVLTACDPSVDKHALEPPEVTDACTEVADIRAFLITTNGVLHSSPLLLDLDEATLPRGTNEIEWVATDAEGNVSSVTQVVRVQAAVQATNQLSVRDRARLNLASGAPGALLSLGTETTSLGVNSLVGEVQSVGPLFLQNYARVSGLGASAGAITKQHGASIAQEQAFALLDVVLAPWLAVHSGHSFAGVDVMLEPNAVRSEAGISFGRVHVKSGARLVLTAGELLVRELWLEPDSTLELTASDVHLILRDKLVNRGRIVSHRAGQHGTVTLLGGELVAEAPLSGLAVIAPNSQVVITTMATGTRVPLLVARRLEIQPDVHLWCDQRATLGVR